MTNSTHARIAAAGLILGPLLLSLGDLLRRLVEPSGTPSASAISEAVGQNGGAWLAAGLLSVAAAFCFVPGVVGLIATARGRGARVTKVGAVMVGVGAVASVGHAAAFYSPYALYVKAHTAGPDLEALDRVSETYPLLIVLIVLFMVGMLLGPVVLLVGLRSARRVPIWSVVAGVLFLVCANTSSVEAGLLGIAAAVVAFLPAALSLTAAPSGPHHDPAAQAVVARS
jgi:hypothetical protein